MGAPEEAKKTRRVKSGKDFWAMHDIAEELDEARKIYSDFCRKLARAHDLYVDQIRNLLTGLVVDDEGKKSRAPDKFIKAIDESPERHNIETINTKLFNEKKRVARKYNVWPDVLDAGTGEIRDRDIESVDPDAEPAPEPEAPAGD